MDHREATPAVRRHRSLFTILSLAAFAVISGGCTEDSPSGATPTDVRPIGPTPGPGPGPDPMPDSTPTVDTAALERLVGRVRFDFGFTGAAEVLTLTTDFELDDIDLDEDGDTLFDFQDSTSYTCDTFPEDAQQFGEYLCVVLPVGTGSALPENQSVLFVFDLMADGNGTGRMEFCSNDPADLENAEQLGAECVARLVISPDGFVNVSVNGAPGTAARAVPLGRELIEVDHGIYLELAQRARPDPGIGARDVSDADARAAAVARELVDRAAGRGR